MITTAATTPYREYSSIAIMAVVNRAASLVGMEKWQRDALKFLAELGKLPLNWDGYRSRLPTESVREWAAELVLRTNLGILPPPQFSPESDGALEIDWHSGHNREVEFHIEPGKPVSFL